MTNITLTAKEEASIVAACEAAVPRPRTDLDMSRVLIVEGLPIVGPEKVSKLLKVIRKKILGVAPLAKGDDAVVMPMDGDASRGVAFVTMESETAAQEAAIALHNVPLDKKHTLATATWETLETCASVPDEFTPPNAADFLATVSAADDAADKVADKEDGESVPGLRSWLSHPEGVDQYAITVGDRTEVHWNSLQAGTVGDLAFGRDAWTDSYISWSPLGSYLVTAHRQGIALWGGDTFERMARIAHAGVTLVSFSPQERFVVTYSPDAAARDSKADPSGCIVWDVRTGKKMRGFFVEEDPDEVRWPYFKWSHDDRFFARLGTDVIDIYDSTTMMKINKKSVSVPGVKAFEWCPAENRLAYVTPETSNQPARVAIVELLARDNGKVSVNDVAQKNLFLVHRVTLHWQSAGDFLAVNLYRHTKSKKRTFNSFEVFRLRDKGTPVEQFELKDEVIDCAWEPAGKLFAVCHGNGPRYDVSMYKMERLSRKAGVESITMVKRLERLACNTLIWAPRGRFIVLAGLRNLNGHLDFFDSNTMEMYGSEEHFMCTSVEWDPTGRYVVTVVSHWRQQLETGYCMFNVLGEKVQAVLKDQFYQFAWRPRPASLLSKEAERKIRNSLPAYIKKMEVEDKKKQQAHVVEARAKRLAAKAELQRALDAAYEQYRAEHAKRVAIYGFDPDAVNDEGAQVEVFEEEEVIEETEEYLE
uniref:Eukaryotic translation initiation factor 3 subunit B n=2 Tax=Sexangularia sp. CB-2014 TaxID=1486929 RepID=A0A7S1YDB3_9EUKA|mmetsp:Transcript_14771/g.46336  ORF Transcript_14771/g.46336 Transcript_14771/m.46336 type:complete len:703 (+) Transcript_14771:202-2310(+)